MKILIFFLFLNGLSAETGLQRAKELIQQPLGSHRQIKDVILSGIVDKLEENAYKLQILHIRVDQAWKWVFTDYGFIN